MTLTTRAMDWLNQNRHRSYPVEQIPWRRVVGAVSPLDGVLLDATVFDSSADAEGRVLVLQSCRITPEATTVTLAYGGSPIVLTLSGGGVDGESSFELVRMSVSDSGMPAPVCVSLALSSHAYLLQTVGVGSFTLGAPIMKCRVVGIPNGRGMDAVWTNGSVNVQGGGAASGDVVLEDGYRTMPIIRSGKVFVRVGVGYGFDPCTYDAGPEAPDQCGELMFFFCGQNATGSKGGNVVLNGGRGIAVTQGKSYRVKSGSAAGRSVPCIEIMANTELMNIYRPGLLDFSLE